MPPQAVVFDFNGTLSDDEPVLCEIFMHLFAEHGRPMSAQEYFDRLAGLSDAGEEADFRRGLERSGFGGDLTRDHMERLGFFVCVADLEDELIRALGASAVERIVEAQGALGSFRTLQKQPAWRGRPTEEQLRRFMGSGGSRKARYARILVDALDPGRVPPPLAGALAHV